MAVSYTHLDVYKRQGVDCSQRELGRNFQQSVEEGSRRRAQGHETYEIILQEDGQCPKAAVDRN